MKKNKVFLGIYLIAAAILLILFSGGIIEGVPVLKVIVPLILLPIIVSGVQHLGFIRILVPIALTAVVFSKELGISHISPWIFIFAALLMGIGINTLIPRRTRLMRKYGMPSAISYNIDPDNIKISTSFGGVQKYVESRNFTSATVESTCSGVEIFFDKATMNTDGANIFFDAKCSGIQLYVPRDWQVVDKLDSFMSGVTIGKSNESPLKLTLRGKVSLCGVDVKYI